MWCSQAVQYLGIFLNNKTIPCIYSLYLPKLKKYSAECPPVFL